MLLDKNDEFKRNMEYVLFVCYLSIMMYCDYHIAFAICGKLKIPYDLALTAISAGFGNDIIILSIFFEIIIFVYIFEKLIPKTIHRIGWILCR